MKKKSIPVKSRRKNKKSGKKAVSPVLTEEEIRQRCWATRLLTRATPNPHSCEHCAPDFDTKPD